MSDIRTCLANAGDEVSKKFSDEAIELFNQYYKETDNLIQDRASAIDKASKETLVIMEGNILQNKRIKLQTMMAKLELNDFLENAKDPYKALIDVGNIRLAQQEKVVMSQIKAPLDQFFYTFRKGGLTGSRAGTDATRKIVPGQKEKHDMLHLVVKEIFNPGTTGNKKAKELAFAYTDASEHARLLFNQSGGAIPVAKAGGYLPQHHHAGRIIAAGYDKWSEATKSLLDREAMVNKGTGIPLTDEELDKVLESVFESITEEGRNKLDGLTADRFGTGASIAKRHQENRVLQFKSGEAWIAYQAEFSDSNIYDIMLNHLRTMSKDISSLQVLGADPESTVEFLKLRVKQIADEKDKGTGKTKNILKANKAAATFDDMWKLHKGLPESVRPTFSKIMRNYNALIMATRLGSTTLIAAPTDMMTVRKMAKYNGMSQMKAINNYAKEIFKLNPGEREQVAAELGLMNEHMMDGTSAALARYLHEDNASPFFQFVVDSSLRMNGLTHITASGRNMSGMFLMSGWADVQTKSFDQLSRQMQVALGRYSITGDEWNKIRKAKAFVKNYSGRDVTYLRGEDIAQLPGLKTGEARKIADKYMQMIFGEIEVGVPTVNYRERAVLAGTTQPGTIAGEITRSFAMFKSWPMAFYHNHLERAWREAGELGTPFAKTKAIADTVLYMTLMGALGVQLMEITRGRKPMEFNPFEDPEEARRFWGNAMVRSGGFGPLFDVAVGLGDYRQGLSGYTSGPVISSLDQLTYALFGSAKEAFYDQEPAKAGTRIMKEVIRNTPYQSNWMLNLMLRRMVWERVLLWNDPTYMKQLQKGIRRDAKEGKEYWWMPGDESPRTDPFN
jgi:hypothetical protein